VPWQYKQIPIPPDYSRPDINLGQLMWFFDCSARTAHRFVETGRVESYKLTDNMLRISFDSAKRLRESLLALGPQTSPRSVTGKRPVGRPRKQPLTSSNEAAS
jgi:hypothetical protein